MTYIIEGICNHDAAAALCDAGYDGHNANLALNAWKTKIPQSGAGTSPVKWKDKELWLPYRWLDKRRLEVDI